MFKLSKYQFEILKNSGVIVDGLWGGLVIALSHKDQGAGMMEIENGEYNIFGQIEGWEYIVNPFATEKYADRLVEMNDELKNSTAPFNGFEIPHGTPIIDLSPITVNYLKQRKIVLLWDYQFFIVSKYSTAKYIDELNQINSYRG